MDIRSSLSRTVTHCRSDSLSQVRYYNADQKSSLRNSITMPIINISRVQYNNAVVTNSLGYSIKIEWGINTVRNKCTAPSPDRRRQYFADQSSGNEHRKENEKRNPFHLLRFLCLTNKCLDVFVFEVHFSNVNCQRTFERKRKNIHFLPAPFPAPAHSVATNWLYRHILSSSKHVRRRI